MSKKQPLMAYDACVAMHAALRKCCDSKITSAAYSLIHLDRDFGEMSPWLIFGGMVAAYMGSGSRPSPRHAIETAIDNLDRAFNEKKEKLEKAGQIVPNSARVFNMLYALRCTLQCFSATDLEGMGSFLTDVS